MKKVTYNKIIGIAFIIPSIFILFVSLQIGPNPSTLSGIIILIMSIAFLTSPGMTYDDEKIEIKSLIGRTIKTYNFNEGDFTIQDNKVYVDGRKIKLSSKMMLSSEYKAFLAHVVEKTSGDGMGIKLSKKEWDGETLDSDL